MHGCKKCMKMGGISLLLLGVLFLVADLTSWNFWNISWWSAILILVGVMKLGMSSCPECNKK